MPMMPMGDVPWWHARTKPERVAVIHGESEIDWLQLAQNATQRARAMQRFGVSKGDAVLMALPNGNPFVETVFAIWMAGGMPIPVAPRMPAIEMRSIAQLAQPKLIIGGDRSALQEWTVLPAEWTASEERK